MLVPFAEFMAGLKRYDIALLCGIWIVMFARNSTALSLLRRVPTNEACNPMGVTWVFAMVIFSWALLVYVLERGSQTADELLGEAGLP